jgi:non-specific serine/threonine protein kinase
MAPGDAAFRRDGDYWTVAYEAPAFRLKNVLGLGYLARLLSTPRREWHVFDLAAIHGAPLLDGQSSAQRGTGDAGPILDDVAKGRFADERGVGVPGV